MPLTKYSNDTQRYVMKLYFHGCMSQQDIKFDNTLQPQLKVIQDLAADASASSKKGFGKEGAIARNSLYRSEN